MLFQAYHSKISFLCKLSYFLEPPMLKTSKLNVFSNCSLYNLVNEKDSLVDHNLICVLREFIPYCRLPNIQHC